jgi:hypothetical protein
MAAQSAGARIICVCLYFKRDRVDVFVGAKISTEDHKRK